MGLLDSVLGAAANSLQGGTDLQGIMGLVGNNPKLLEVATSLLANDGGMGGLAGLVTRFQQAGLGDVIGSWIGTGQNMPISAEQLSNVLGGDALSGVASRLGLKPDDVANQLSSILPGVVDKLTPAGQAPANGLGNVGDLMGVLGGFMRG